MAYSELREKISKINTLNFIFNLQSESTITILSYILFVLAIPFTIWLLYKSTKKLNEIIEAEPGAIYNETYNTVTVLIIKVC